MEASWTRDLNKLYIYWHKQRYMPENTFNLSFPHKAWGRRDFLTTLAALSAPAFIMGPVAAAQQRNRHTGAYADPAAQAACADMTIREVIDALLADIPGAPFPNTVDTIKAGDPGQAVKGIVTTMFATEAVIAKTIGLGANFIIAHEPTYYNHLDETAWLGNDPVFKAKERVLKEHGICVWRFHDGIHAHKPDGIRMGVLQALGWDAYYHADTPAVMTLPGITLKDLITHMKKSLGIEHLKYIGDPEQVCSKVVLSPGAGGGKSQIAMIEQYQPDLLICGELNEWETSEYVRDARYIGGKIALVVLGHSVSEEPGMEWLVPVLQQKAPGVKVTHIISGDAFSWA
jgi:putative NIF3 family GTP cyclohydrolase 1 type 2